MENLESEIAALEAQITHLNSLKFGTLLPPNGLWSNATSRSRSNWNNTNSEGLV